MFKEHAQDVAVELPREIRQMRIESQRPVHNSDKEHGANLRCKAGYFAVRYHTPAGRRKSAPYFSNATVAADAAVKKGTAKRATREEEG